MTITAAVAPHHSDLAGALTPTQAGEYLGDVAPRTLQNWRSGGRGPAYVSYGTKIVYRVADLDAFLAAHRVDPASGGDR